MSLGRKMMALLLAGCAASAAAGAPTIFGGSGEHHHSASLTIENGELHVVFYHHDRAEDADHRGTSLESPDHDIRVADPAAVVASTRVTSGQTAFVAAVMATTHFAVSQDAGAGIITSLKAPPPLPPEPSSILRI